MDVFIPTYNEPLTDRPGDGSRRPRHGLPGRQDERDRCSTTAAATSFATSPRPSASVTLTRETNLHAKAGNINHALEHTRGEFIAIFDADHIPTRDFLRMTLGPFLNDRANGAGPDARITSTRRIRSSGTWNASARFPTRGNCSIAWCRTATISGMPASLRLRAPSCGARRSTQIGGIAVETVTEDAHTALRLHRAGWHTAYLEHSAGCRPGDREPRARTSANAFDGRAAWCRFCAWRTRYSAAGLTVPQRLCYFNATTHYPVRGCRVSSSDRFRWCICCSAA